MRVFDAISGSSALDPNYEAFQGRGIPLRPAFAYPDINMVLTVY